jgi:NAD(P)-dependent dehydrogenase (short-subunit alcohol dehydrogenase family)
LGHRGHPSGGIQFDKLKTTHGDIFFILGRWIRYGQSKLANLLYARAYAEHHPSIVSVSIHPGVSATGLVTSLGFFDRWFVYVTNIGNMLTPEQCAWNQQWAATARLGKDDGEVESGTYYEPVGAKGRLVRSAADDELASKLWEWTEKELEGFSL